MWPAESGSPHNGHLVSLAIGCPLRYGMLNMKASFLFHSLPHLLLRRFIFMGSVIKQYCWHVPEGVTVVGSCHRLNLLPAFEVNRVMVALAQLELLCTFPNGSIPNGLISYTVRTTVLQHCLDKPRWSYRMYVCTRVCVYVHTALHRLLNSILLYSTTHVQHCQLYTTSRLCVKCKIMHHTQRFVTTVVTVLEVTFTSCNVRLQHIYPYVVGSSLFDMCSGLHA